MWPLFVLCSALAVRFWGIDWQLPAALYFDEMKYVAWAGDAKDDATAAVRDLRNPTFFHHLLQVEYAIAAAVRGDRTAQETAVFELRLARLTSAVLGALACLLTAFAARWTVRAARGIRSPSDTTMAAQPPTEHAAAWAGCAAGLILALAPLHVHLSHYATNDVTASLFLAGTLFLGARALATGRRRDHLLAGLLSGLAFSTKYSFAVAVLLPLVAALGRAQHRLGGRGLLVAIVAGGFVLGALLGAPEIIRSPLAMLDGIADQARLGAVRWNGQSDAPVWRLYLETLVHGLGWPALLVVGAGAVALALRARLVLLATAIVPIGCLAVMLRQELFFARFALPLLPSLAVLAGIGTVMLARWAARPVGARPAVLAALALAVLAGQLMPEIVTTVRHNLLATTTDTRVLARRWLRQRLDGARVVTEVYGQPIAWEGNESPRGYRLLRVPNLAEVSTVRRLVCDGNRFFIVASLTAERELARRGERSQESGYALLAREGRPVAVFDPFVPGQVAPSHPDNTGIPFWYLEQYERPGPKIIIYELSNETFACPPDRR
jgi:hypothetical protein